MLNPKGPESFYYEAGGGDGVLITGTFQDSLRSLQGKTVAGSPRRVIAIRWRPCSTSCFEEGGHRTDAVYAVMDEPTSRRR